ncbi:T. brucei spp.-specific protein [Trypanosoma brucei gambiense DAL972]|uniref:T. brucei spp.-specific protein n=1 Tax=Trypanosoma brucei gambiense (strain MHOM/CI/86/DAL972) TaxID=679716 RepID=D0A076_TRYB9|nr:T. brucei spp.-specific protein [Trypanosoma brucei gambiense DAL972]CBH16634.1 T. brucei spp.-specific protein [Trypanosoma brucei gambiense DAL972]|eukprot:XP_011778898.1 T. brucei spp.-specific protein [Trypanosoma brucei gambiense DAL972]
MDRQFLCGNWCLTCITTVRVSGMCLYTHTHTHIFVFPDFSLLFFAFSSSWTLFFIFLKYGSFCLPSFVAVNISHLIPGLFSPLSPSPREVAGGGGGDLPFV